jgi:hypothetical protein
MARGTRCGAQWRTGCALRSLLFTLRPGSNMCVERTGGHCAANDHSFPQVYGAPPDTEERYEGEERDEGGDELSDME